MRHNFACLAVLLVLFGILASDTFAQRPEPVNQALRARYGDAATEIVDSEVINGVRVYDVRIVSESGRSTSTAQMTENGDFIFSGIPASFSGYPDPVRQLQQIFNTRVQNVETFVINEYHVDIEVAGGTHRLRFDPAGRVQGLARPEQLRRDADAPEAGEDAPAELRDRLQESVKRYYPDAQISGVRRHATNPNLYVVEVKGEQAQGDRVVFTQEGHLYLRSQQIPVDQLPEPARETVQQTFGDRVKIQRAARSEHEVYQFAQATAGDDMLVFRVRADGDVIDVRPLTPEEDQRRDEARIRTAGEAIPQPQQEEGRKRNRD
jgi:hypothetical protein